MSTKLYTNVPVYIDGALATEQNEVKVDRDLGNIPNVTTANGFAGVTPGAAQMTISLRNAVPAAGFENKLGGKAIARETVKLTILAGGATLTQNMYVMSDSLDGGAGKATELSYVFHGPWAKWSSE